MGALMSEETAGFNEAPADLPGSADGRGPDQLRGVAASMRPRQIRRGVPAGQGKGRAARHWLQ